MKLSTFEPLLIDDVDSPHFQYAGPDQEMIEKPLYFRKFMSAANDNLQQAVTAEHGPFTGYTRYLPHGCSTSLLNEGKRYIYYGVDLVTNKILYITEAVALYKGWKEPETPDAIYCAEQLTTRDMVSDQWPVLDAAEQAALDEEFNYPVEETDSMVGSDSIFTPNKTATTTRTTEEDSQDSREDESGDLSGDDSNIADDVVEDEAAEDVLQRPLGRLAQEAILTEQCQFDTISNGYIIAEEIKYQKFLMDKYRAQLKRAPATLLIVKSRVTRNSSPREFLHHLLVSLIKANFSTDDFRLANAEDCTSLAILTLNNPGDAASAKEKKKKFLKGAIPFYRLDGRSTVVETKETLRFLDVSGREFSLILTGVSAAPIEICMAEVQKVYQALYPEIAVEVKEHKEPLTYWDKGKKTIEHATGHIVVTFRIPPGEETPKVFTGILQIFPANMETDYKVDFMGEALRCPQCQAPDTLIEDSCRQMVNGKLAWHCRNICSCGLSYTDSHTKENCEQTRRFGTNNCYKIIAQRLQRAAMTLRITPNSTAADIRRSYDALPNADQVEWEIRNEQDRLYNEHLFRSKDLTNKRKSCWTSRDREQKAIEKKRQELLKTRAKIDDVLSERSAASEEVREALRSKPLGDRLNMTVLTRNGAPTSVVPKPVITLRAQDKMSYATCTKGGNTWNNTAKSYKNSTPVPSAKYVHPPSLQDRLLTQRFSSPTPYEQQFMPQSQRQKAIPNRQKATRVNEAPPSPTKKKPKVTHTEVADITLAPNNTRRALTSPEVMDLQTSTSPRTPVVDSQEPPMHQQIVQAEVHTDAVAATQVTQPAATAIPAVPTQEEMAVLDRKLKNVAATLPHPQPNSQPPPVITKVPPDKIDSQAHTAPAEVITAVNASQDPPLPPAAPAESVPAPPPLAGQEEDDTM